MSSKSPRQKHRRPGEQRFGLRPPRDGSAAPIRVLVNVRWFVSGIVALLAALVATLAIPSRRRLPALSAALLMGGATAAAAFAEARRLRFERVSLDVPDLPSELDGFTIGQITDVHLGWPFTSTNLQRSLDWFQQVQPDLLALTGDFIGHDLDIDLLRSQLAGITAPAGVYAVFGNHDYWVDTAAIEQLFQDLNIVLLRNEQRTITINDARLVVVGVDCVWEAQHNVEQAFTNRSAEMPTIVLAHEPDVADDIAPYKPILQLSGHTHGGHFALPGLGPAFLPRHGFRYFRGIQRVGEMWLYVSRGVGGFPLRLGSPPEVTLFTLRRTSRNA